MDTQADESTYQKNFAAAVISQIPFEVRQREDGSFVVDAQLSDGTQIEMGKESLEQSKNVLRAQINSGHIDPHSPHVAIQTKFFENAQEAIEMAENNLALEKSYRNDSIALN